MEHCGAITRADCEVRMGTVSEGMSKVSEVISTSKEGGGQGYLRGFISELRFHCQRVIPSSVHGQADKSPLQCFRLKEVSPARGQGRLLYQTVTAVTLEGNRGVRQIKWPYPVAAVCACVL